MKGLDNLGNTCYFNSALQCLLQTPVLSNHMIKNKYEGNCEFTQEYRKFTRIFWSKGDTNPKKLLEIFRKKFKRFDNSQEHDAHEALVCIIDILENSIPEVKQMFYGTLNKDVIYPGGKSHSDETMGPLMLTCTKNCSLQDLIKDHLSDTVLEGYQDDNGKTYNVAVLKQTIAKKPPILIFCINMFIRKKNINIPQIYENYVLYACCLHMGSTRGGHYVAFTKHKNKWYLKDDTTVREVKHPPESGPFYLCMYKERC